MLIWLINRIRFLKKDIGKLCILSLLLSVLIFGSIAFYYFERTGEGVNDIWDAVYWVIVTITTVGFGDITPQTMGGRITFVLVALGGIGTIAYVIEQLVSFSTKSALKKLSGSGVIKMKKHTIIVGWNTKAEEAIKELKNKNEEFLVLGSELNQTELNALEMSHISGDPTKIETLNRCNIANAKTMMILLASDSEVIMIALVARKLNPGIKIVATCEMQEHMEMMREAGIDQVISFAEISGRLLAHAVTEPVVVKFIMDASTSVEGFALKQIKIVEKTRLADISLSNKEKMIALYRGGGFFFEFPVGLMLVEGDYVLVVSSSAAGSL